MKLTLNLCLFLWLFFIAEVHGKGSTCITCYGVESLDECTQATDCADNEVCFTELYTDDNGHHKYRLGCEQKDACHMTFKAVIGKRHLPGPSPIGQCYDCCSHDKCNTGMCRNYKANAGCPGNFKPFIDNCYLFDAAPRYQTESIRHCQDLGAHLEHSKQENDFLDMELKAVNVTSFNWYLTGGYRDHGRYNFHWMDGTPWDYSNWEFTSSVNSAVSYCQTLPFRSCILSGLITLSMIQVDLSVR